MKRTISGKTIAPYSPAVIYDDRLVFVSGQIPDAKGPDQLSKGQPPIPTDIGSQTRSVLDKLKAVLEQAGASLDTVLKTTVFLTNMNDFPAFNAVYKDFFPKDPPARSTIGVASLPLGVNIEIEAIAFCKDVLRNQEGK